MHYLSIETSYSPPDRKANKPYYTHKGVRACTTAHTKHQCAGTRKSFYSVFDQKVESADNTRHLRGAGCGVRGSGRKVRVRGEGGGAKSETRGER